MKLFPLRSPSNDSCKDTIIEINSKNDYANYRLLSYSKNPYIRILNFEVQAAIGSYKRKYQAVRSLNRFLIYETVKVQEDNLQFYGSMQGFNTIKVSTQLRFHARFQHN